MTEIIREAQCLCGAVRAETRGEPARVLTCSCIDCRRKSGSAFSVSTYWHEGAVTLTGETKTWKRAGQDGRMAEYFHCTNCGVSLYWRMDFAPNKIGIGGGNFDPCDFAVPEKAFWTEYRPDWVLNLQDIPKLTRQ